MMLAQPSGATVGAGRNESQSTAGANGLARTRAPFPQAGRFTSGSLTFQTVSAKAGGSNQAALELNSTSGRSALGQSFSVIVAPIGGVGFPARGAMGQAQTSTGSTPRPDAVHSRSGPSTSPFATATSTFDTQGGPTMVGGVQPSASAKLVNPPPPPGGDPPPPGGGDTFKPVVTIVSPGLHAYETTLPPQYVQGQRYDVSAAYNSYPNQTDGPQIEWRPLKDVWTYPTGVVKGYGSFQKMNGDPDGPYTVFVSPPTDAPNTIVDLQDFTPDDLDKDRQQAGDHFIDHFFFGPVSIGDVSLNVTTTFGKFIDGVDTGLRANAGDGVVLNIVQPQGTMEILEVGTAGLGPAGSTPLNLQFDKDRVRPVAPNPIEALHPGVKWRVHVDPPLKREGTSFGGDFMTTQTIPSSIRRRSYSAILGPYIQELIRLPDKTSPCPCLDSSVGFYPGAISLTATGSFQQPVGAEFATVGTYMTSADAPFQSLATTIDGYPTGNYYVSDKFLSTLMYWPDKTMGVPNSIPVPIKYFRWEWGGSAYYAQGSWFLGANADHTANDAKPFQGVTGQGSTALFPIWGHNINEFLVNPTWVHMNY